MKSHSHDEQSDNIGSRKLAIVAFLNLIGFIAELIGGLVFGSVALLSDAFHMIFDMLAYALAYFATYIAERNSSDEYNIHRVEPLAAFLNGVLLIPMVGYIVWESYQRFLSPISIDTFPVLIIAVFGLIINSVSVYVLESDNMSLNEKGAFYHLLGDAGGSIAVIISIIIIELFGIKIIDPIVAIGIGILILFSAYKVLNESMSIFMHNSPVNKTHIHSQISDIDGIENIHCIHAWQICSQITVASVRAQIPEERFSDIHSINRTVHQILSKNGIDHATVELSSETEQSDIVNCNCHSHY